MASKYRHSQQIKYCYGTKPIFSSFNNQPYLCFAFISHAISRLGFHNSKHINLKYSLKHPPYIFCVNNCFILKVCWLWINKGIVKLCWWMCEELLSTLLNFQFSVQFRSLPDPLMNEGNFQYWIIPVIPIWKMLVRIKFWTIANIIYITN